jgi:hypothetical protein
VGDYDFTPDALGLQHASVAGERDMTSSAGMTVQRIDALEMMSEPKFYGMKSARDETLAAVLWRERELRNWSTICSRRRYRGRGVRSDAGSRPVSDPSPSM